MMPTATVPGFRPGRAPRKLVEHRYRKEVHEQVKGSLLMDSVSQVSEEQNFAAISEPDFDLEAVEVPDDGPLTFEFDIEVRPEFDLPEWKGLLVERPVREFNDGTSTGGCGRSWCRTASSSRAIGPAEAGDYVTTNLTVAHDGQRGLFGAEEQVIRICKVLSFRDGTLEDFDTLMAGVQAGDVRQAKLELSVDAPNKELRGQQVGIEFEVLDVKELRLPELTDGLPRRDGRLRDRKRICAAPFARIWSGKLAYYQARQMRQQITAALTASAELGTATGTARTAECPGAGANGDGAAAQRVQRGRDSGPRECTPAEQHGRDGQGPEGTLHSRTDRRGRGDRRHRRATTTRKSQLIALQSGDSVRRVRAQLEKRGLMDVLRNQIVERKVIDLVRSHARFQDRPYEPDETDVEAIDLAVGGGDGEPPIPEATQGSTNLG